MSYWSKKLQHRDGNEKLCMETSWVTSPSQKMLWNGKNKAVFMKVAQGRTERVGWWDQQGLVKVCARASIYIHVLQQDLHDLFSKHTNPAWDPHISGHLLWYGDFGSNAASGALALGCFFFPFTISSADGTWAACTMNQVKKLIHGFKKVNLSKFGIRWQGSAGVTVVKERMGDGWC